MSILLQPFAAAYRLGVTAKGTAYKRGFLKTRRLGRPVVSVGNVTLGGTGKTPLVTLVAGTLLKHGRKPVILTRGYGRRSRGMIPIEPRVGRTPDPREVGDEAALLARALPEVPIVVSADRYIAGRIAEERFDVDVHVLDDGFQHWSLGRDLDIVTLDATRELSDRAVLPAGRQREPCAALARAQVVVITRAELSDAASLESQVRRINPQARVFRSHTKLCGLSDARSGKTTTPEAFRGERAPGMVAFCGIGNPEAFFADLRQWGLVVAAERAYRDHHVYSAGDVAFLQKLALRSGAAALVTTEKDIMNLPPTAKFDLPLVACSIRIELGEAAEFEETLLAACVAESGKGRRASPEAAETRKEQRL